MLEPGRRAVMAGIAGLLGLAVAPAWSQGTDPDTAAGLRALFTDMLEAARVGNSDRLARLIGGLVLPDRAAWFKRMFGEEAGGRVAAEYARALPSLEPDLTKLLTKSVQDGATNVEVLFTATPDDGQVTGSTRDAYLAMTKPQPLYVVRLKKPGEPRGITLFAFAFVDGGFRLLGKMRALTP